MSTHLADISVNVLELKQFLSAIPLTGDNHTLIAAADARLVEFMVLATMAAGETYPFRKELAGITQDMNQAVLAIEKRFEQVMQTGDDAEILQRMAISEDGMWKLDNARIMMLLSLAHMSHALDATTLPSFAKAPSNA